MVYIGRIPWLPPSGICQGAQEGENYNEGLIFFHQFLSGSSLEAAKPRQIAVQNLMEQQFFCRYAIIGL